MLGPAKTGDPACRSIFLSSSMEGERPLQKADLGYVGPYDHNNFLPEVERGPDP